MYWGMPVASHHALGGVLGLVGLETFHYGFWRCSVGCAFNLVLAGWAIATGPMGLGGNVVAFWVPGAHPKPPP